MWLILQNDEPDDFVIATGEMHTVREFCELAFKEVGFDIHWEGEGINEKGYDTIITYDDLTALEENEYVKITSLETAIIEF